MAVFATFATFATFALIPGATCGGADEALRQPEPRQSDTPFDWPWPLDHWPDMPTRVIAGSDDRLFPMEFQRRVVRGRLGLDVDVMPGEHLMALSRPQELVDLLVDFTNSRRIR